VVAVHEPLELDTDIRDERSAKSAIVFSTGRYCQNSSALSKSAC